MARTPSNDSRSQRSRQPRNAAPPAPRRAVAEAPGADTAPLFPFARTVEDDELRDMSGYGWGV
jgi:hypothetical protein